MRNQALCVVHDRATGYNLAMQPCRGMGGCLPRTPRATPKRQRRNTPEPPPEKQPQKGSAKEDAHARAQDADAFHAHDCGHGVRTEALSGILVSPCASSPPKAEKAHRPQNGGSWRADYPPTPYGVQFGELTAGRGNPRTHRGKFRRQKSAAHKETPAPMSGTRTRFTHTNTDMIRSHEPPEAEPVSCPGQPITSMGTV